MADEPMTAEELCVIPTAEEIAELQLLIGVARSEAPRAYKVMRRLAFSHDHMKRCLEQIQLQQEPYSAAISQYALRQRGTRPACWDTLSEGESNASC